MARKNRCPEGHERRAKIRELLRSSMKASLFNKKFHILMVATHIGYLS